ncbi:MAG: ABC transporter permease [Myxococcales bacterium]|nr:ABC transporter permease [Myxococcales bacterium]USN50641.1 MAG: ABC transporter permease [Myxococcales bacterium]
MSVTSLRGKCLSLIAVMFGATIIVSGSLRLVPGDPIDHILGDQAQEASRELLARDLGLVNENGQPVGFIDQYAGFIKSLLRNDIKSFMSRDNALDIILSRLPYTIALASCSMLIAIILGPILGVFASLFRHRWPDHLLSLFALAGISIPSFFLGPVLLLIFAIKYAVLPISGADDGIRSLILPSISMGTALAAMLARISRASMLEVLSEDFIRTAQAKGLAPSTVFFKHALRNALIPVITLVGLQFGAVLAGSVITEKIFNWPGIGLLLLESIQRLDMPLVQTCVLVIALIYALINIATDILYSFVDPRISIGGSR